MRVYEITTLLESFKDAKVKFTNEEDEHTVDVYIDTFKELANRNIITGQDKDIGKWIKAGWEEFKAFVDDAKEKNSNRDVKKKRINKSSEYIILADNDEFTAVIPLTERASCYYGKSTNWCVSVVSEDNMFDAYVAAGKFPVHVNKEGEVYSFVYDFIQQDVVEYRDSQNKKITPNDFNNKIVDTQPLITKMDKYENKLMKLSESKRLESPRTAIYYALNEKARFEEGEDLIATSFVYSLNYMLKCLHYMKVPVIDKTLLSQISDVTHYRDGDNVDAIEVLESYLRKHYVNEDLPSYADENYIMKSFPKFYLKHLENMGEFLNEKSFKEILEYHSSYHEKMAKQETDGMHLSFLDFNGLTEVNPALDYIAFLHDNEQEIEGYIKVFYEVKKPKKVSIVSYIINNGYKVGFSDKLLDGLPEDTPLSLQNVFDIIRDAPNGEYIFTDILPSQISVEALYKMGKVNPRIYKIIGEIPQNVKDYAEEEDLELPDL